jgi:UDP-N-acetylglucosamine 1-carboxyvinyltransferase
MLSNNRLRIEGGVPLRGRVCISGAKNAALVLIAASIMAKGETILDNVPYIEDVNVLIRILQEMGVKVHWNEDHSLSIQAPDDMIRVQASADLTRKLRASNLLLGSMLGRQAKVAISVPGGCDIGLRPMDLHIKGVQALGATVDIKHDSIFAERENSKGAPIYLDFPSVGATENIMMMAALTPGDSTIENAAKEPEIVNLASYLNAMGASIRGAGTDVIRITGVPELKAVRYSTIPDRIEAGTYMLAAAATGGEVVLENVIPQHVYPVIAKLREMGVVVEEQNPGELLVKTPGKLKPVDIKTMPYPGFPTDMQPQIAVLLGLSSGTSIVTEGIFENRFKYVDEMTKMGAHITVESSTAIIDGVQSYSGASLYAPDLRAGAALVMAALAANGISRIYNIHYIERGYEDLPDKIRSLGGEMVKVNDGAEDSDAMRRMMLKVI